MVFQLFSLLFSLNDSVDVLFKQSIQGKLLKYSNRAINYARRKFFEKIEIINTSEEITETNLIYKCKVKLQERNY